MTPAPLPQQTFGQSSDGQETRIYTLTNENGVVAKVSDFGATLVELHLPGPDGNVADVVLGFDSVEGYESKSNQYFGCTVGRVANRIADGRFSLEGSEHVLATNDASNHLHGGVRGFGQRLWQAETLRGKGAQAIRLTYRSEAGEEGYPGTLTAVVTYTLTDDALSMDHVATTDTTTLVNLTNHSYFNLNGAGSETVLDHSLEMVASHYTPTDERLIPTGEVLPVDGSVLDFRFPRIIGDRIDELENTPSRGYDHNFVLDDVDGTLRHAATLHHLASGRRLEIWTTEPGLQFYSGNFLEGQPGKGGLSYARRSALCLEPQRFPDAIHHPHFPSVVLRPGDEYRHEMQFRFGSGS